MFYTSSSPTEQVAIEKLKLRSGESADYWKNLQKAMNYGIFSDREQQIRFTSWNGATNVTRLVCRYEILYSNGDIEESQVTQVPNTDRSAKITTFDPGVGWIIGMSVYFVGSQPRKGQCYVKVETWDVNDSLAVKTLIANYLDGTNVTSWPYGFNAFSIDGVGILRTLFGTNPAAGVEISVSVPNNTRWKLRGIRFSLVTGVAVPARRVAIVIKDPANVVYSIDVGATQAASLTVNYDGIPGLPTTGATLVDTDFFIPLDCMLFGLYTINTVTSGLDAADDFGAPLIFLEEWIEI